MIQRRIKNLLFLGIVPFITYPRTISPTTGLRTFTDPDHRQFLPPLARRPFFHLVKCQSASLCIDIFSRALLADRRDAYPKNNHSRSLSRWGEPEYHPIFHGIFSVIIPVI